MIILWESFGAFVAILGFAAFLGVPKKYLAICGIDGAIGWFIYLIVEQYTQSAIIASFVGAVVISIGAHICARAWKKPVTIFLLPANMTIVPGAGMYRIVYSIIQSNEDMTGYYFSQTLQIAGMIALAMFVVSSICAIFMRGIQGLKEKQMYEG